MLEAVVISSLLRVANMNVRMHLFYCRRVSNINSRMNKADLGALD